MTTIDQLIDGCVDAAVQRRADELRRPELVTQRSVERVVGMPATDFLQHARSGAFASWKVRRLVFAETAGVVAFIRAHPTKPSVPANDAGDDEARILAQFGARRVG